MAICIAPAGAAAASWPTFSIPAQPIETALVAFAVQAGVSIGGEAGAGCGGAGRPVFGRMTPARALARLLASSRCSFTFVDAATARITLAPARAEPPPRRPPPPMPPPPSPPPEPSGLSELVVTAAKRPLPIGEAPYSVTAVPGSSLALTGGGGLSALTGQVAGLALTNLGSGRDKIFIRGVSDGAFTGRTQSTVGLYLDDVPITYDAPDPDLLLADIQQVEVLRGPQGTLYGAGSIGGIVRLVTRKPDLDAFSGSVLAGAAATNGGSGSRLGVVVVNAPIRRGVLAVRAVAYQQVSGGYIGDIGLGLEKVNRSRKSGGRLALAWDARPGLSITAGLTHQSINAADAQYTQAALGPRQRRKRLREPHDNAFDQVFATVRGYGSWGEAKVSVAYVNHDLSSRYDASGAFRGVNPVAGSPIAFDDHQQVDLMVIEGNLSSPPGARLTWLTGAFLSDSGETDRSTARSLATHSVFFLSERVDRLTETALYGEVGYALTPRLKLSGGLRLFGSRLSTHASAMEGGRSSRFIGRLTNTDVSPKLVASYGGAGWLAYAQVSEGYRSGGFNGEPHVGLAKALPRAFLPDELWNYEAGARLALLEGRLRLRLAAFHADWTDLQSDQYLPSGLPVTINVGNGSIDGVELEAGYAPDHRLQIHASLLLDHPQLTRARGRFPARVHNGLPGVSAFTGGLSATYRWQPRPGVQARLTGEASYVGRSYLTFDASSATREGGYAVGTVSASLEAGPWRLEVYIDNVTDERANTFAHGNPFSRPTQAQATPLRPRTTGLQITRSF